MRENYLVRPVIINLFIYFTTLQSYNVTEIKVSSQILLYAKVAFIDKNISD